MSDASPCRFRRHDSLAGPLASVARFLGVGRQLAPVGEALKVGPKS
jgi:hypothetical protein